MGSSLKVTVSCANNPSPTDRICTLRVANGKHTISVHKGVLYQSSEFLKAAVDSEWVSITLATYLETS